MEDGFRIIPEKAEKHIAKGMLGFTVIAVLVNRKPIDRLAFFVRPVGVSFVMLHVNAIVEGLAEADGDRFEKREETIEQRRSEIGIVNEVVRDAVDVPRDADGIEEAEDQHHPERDSREKKEQSEEIGAMEKRGQNRNDIPAGKGKNPGSRLEPLRRDIVDGVHA